MTQDIKLLVEIKNTAPIELSDLTSSLAALNSQYSLYVKQHLEQNICNDTRLYVKEVRNGSAIFELVNIVSATVLPFMENANTLIGFVGYIRDVFKFFLNKSDTKPELTTGDCRDLMHLVNPIVADNGAHIKIGTYVNGNATIIVQADNTEANTIQNGLRRENERLSITEQTAVYCKVVMTWSQTNSDMSNNTKNRGVIDAIFKDKSLKVLFDDDDTKREMLYGSENPLTTAYVVDVKVETSQDRPVAYRVMKLHEKFDI